MAITNFIPELWAANLLELWNAENVVAPLVNREYEGLATKGNTVHITGIVAPTVTDYKAAGRVTTAAAVTDTSVDLLIDQEKSTDFYVDDIDRAQAAGALTAYTTAAAYALAADTDSFLCNLMVDNGTPLAGALPGSGDTDAAEDAFNLIRDARKALNKANVPSDNRVILCNAEFEAALLGAAAKITKVDESGDSNGLRNATLGRILDFRIVTSNHLPEEDSYQFLAFHPRAVAFVSQIDQVEALRAENKFADRARALHVYGGKVVRPEGVLVFNQAGT